MGKNDWVLICNLLGIDPDCVTYARASKDIYHVINDIGYVFSIKNNTFIGRPHGYVPKNTDKRFDCSLSDPLLHDKLCEFLNG